MAKINVTSGTASAYGQGELQLQNKAPMDSTLRPVTDSANTASPLNLSTSLVQTTSTLKITTNDNPYIDAEDGSGNNRFTVGRDTGSQQVNVDFASNPGGSTTIVGAIRTYVDGVNLSEVMAFREDGNIGINTLTPGAKLDIHSASNVIMQLNRTGAGKSWLQYLQAGTARWNTGYDNTNGNFTIYDAVAAADRMVVTNAGNVGIGTSAPPFKLSVSASDTSNSYPTNASIHVVNSEASNFGRIMGMNFAVGAGSSSEIISGVYGVYTGYTTSTGGALSFVTNDGSSSLAERMRITSAGNVGIGTTTPNTPLSLVAEHVGGQSTFKIQPITSYALSGLSSIGFNDSDGTRKGLVLVEAAGMNIITESTSPIRFSVNSVERGRWTTDGLTFNGDTAAANALDDYEEGTWTMGVSFGGGTTGITYSVNSGSYTKIGRQVTVTGYCVLTAKGSSTGNARITGLPFTIAGASGNYSAPTLYFENINFLNVFEGFGVNGTTTIALYETTLAGSVSVLDDTNFSNTSAFIINFTYFV